MLRLAGLLVLSSGLVTVASCTTQNSTRIAGIEQLGQASFCSVAELISYSRLDSVETVKQIREHNAVYDKEELSPSAAQRECHVWSAGINIGL